MDTQNNSLFALDIGTRSIIGIVGHYGEDELFHVEAMEEAQHPKRAMLDGQIEDIRQVARVAGSVKQRLEDRIGRPLTHVAVAAAGRALKTQRAVWKTAMPATPADAQFVYELEAAAVDEARRLLDAGDDSTQYYCVGHSVVRFAIDGYPFSSILQHTGGEAEVEIIATFLPTEVVTSLRRCMELIDLDIDTLTLEPIAAMRAVLPGDVRLLNLAMVDIGAGTADIALTRDGAVAGYTMATVAGDEVTEAIIKKCLVDFETAEGIKRVLESESSVSFEDILGHQQTMPTADLLDAIDMSVEMLAKVIADKIEEGNGGPPAAVFLVGGGSRTPGLGPRLAERMGLPADKVAVAGTRFTGRILAEGAGLDAPEYATPVGIALTAADEAAAGRCMVTVNGRPVRLFAGEDASIMDAVLLAGYRYSDLMGQNGQSVTFQLNGVRKVARGTPYTVAEVKLGGKLAGLTARLTNGAEIELVPAESGVDAQPRIGDYAEPGAPAFLNGLPVGPEVEIHEGDEVEIGTAADAPPVASPPADIPVADASEEADIPEAAAPEAPAPEAAVPKPAPPAPPEAAEPAPAAPAQSMPGPAPVPEMTTAPPPAPRPEAAPVPPAPPKAEAPAPAAPAKPEPQPAAATEPAPAAPAEPGQPAAAEGGSLRIRLNGRTVVLPPKPAGEHHSVLDLLPLVDIDPQQPKGDLVLQVNGHDTGYLERVRSGDRVDIRWDETKSGPKTV